MNCSNHILATMHDDNDFLLIAMQLWFVIINCYTKLYEHLLLWFNHYPEHLATWSGARNSYLIL